MLYRYCYIFLLFRCETRHIDSYWFFVCCWLHCNRVVPDKNISFLNCCFCIFCFCFCFFFEFCFGSTLYIHLVLCTIFVWTFYIFFLNFCIFCFYIQLLTVHFFLNFCFFYVQVFTSFFFWILLFTLFFLCTTLFIFFERFFFYIQLCLFTILLFTTVRLLGLLSVSQVHRWLMGVVIVH